MKGRIPVKALDYQLKDIAEKKELLVDYTNGALYIVSADDRTKLFSLVDSLWILLQESGIDGDDITINIDNIGKVNLGTIITNLYENKVQMIDIEKEKYAGNKYQYDSMSLNIKKNKIQINGFDTAQDNYIAQKFGGVIRWVPIEIAGGGDTTDAADVVTIVPDSGEITILSYGKQKTNIIDAGTYNVVLPSVSKDYNRIEWNLSIGAELPKITFPTSIAWSFITDKDILSESIISYEFITWDKGLNWLTKVSKYGAGNISHFVTKDQLEQNYFNRPEITKMISWEKYKKEEGV